MHILYVDQHFKTPEEGGAIRSYYLAKGLVDVGHQVTLVSGYSGGKYKRVFIDGIHVHYLSLPPRLWQKQERATLRFVRLVCQRVSLLQQADVCYLATNSSAVALIGLYFRWKFNRPFYAEVPYLNHRGRGDASASVSSSPPLRRWLRRRVEAHLIQRATGLVALTPAVARHLRWAAPQQTVCFLPNMADCQFFSHAERTGYHERQFGVAGKFVVTYFGPLEPDHQLRALVDAARACQRLQLNDVQFLVVGKGSDKVHLRSYTQQEQVNNLRFLPHQNKYGLLSILNVTDAVYVPSDDHTEAFYRSSFVFFDALAAGKLCVTNAPGWVTDTVEKNACGFFASPHQPNEFARQLAPFVNNPSLLNRCQVNARALGEQQFARKKQVNVLLDTLGISPQVHQPFRGDTLPA